MLNGSCSPGRILLVLSLALLFACAGFTVVDAQDLPAFPGQSNPSNDCGCSRGDDTIPVSSGMLSPFLPKIPNLELGFLYSFGNNVRAGRFTADYLLPYRLTSDSVLFGEAHAEGWDFRKRSSGAASNRIDLSFGGGYRTMLGANTLLGVNGFYDASRLFNTSYSSGSVGLEFAANLAGDDAIDLSFNWYGNLFNRDFLVNAFRNKGNSFDVEAGYSHALFNQALDLRLKLAGYRFDVGDKVFGWRGGADLTTRDGVFTLRYEYGRDRLNGDYNTVGGFVNVGFQLENLLSGESPFTLPEPIFRSPRDLRRLLGLKVKRNWHQPTAVVQTRTGECSNLHGSILRKETILRSTPIPGSSFTPAIPDLPETLLLPFTLCWCKFLNPPQEMRMGIVTSRILYQSEIFRIDSASGCLPLTGRSLGRSPNPNLVVFWVSSGSNLFFGAGGGVSIQIQ